MNETVTGAVVVKEILNRKRKPKEGSRTDITRMGRDLRDRGIQASEKQMVSAFRELEKEGKGTVIKGRPNRFKWHVAAETLGALIKQTAPLPAHMTVVFVGGKPIELKTPSFANNEERQAYKAALRYEADRL